jgi:Holliday junction DNA helicase RuvB
MPVAGPGRAAAFSRQLDTMAKPPPRAYVNPDALEGAFEGVAEHAQAERAAGAPAAAAERDFENALRPPSFAEFVGQRRAVDNLRVALAAARARGEPPDHVLLSGPPGLGKTTLARLIAAELGSHLHSATGPALERPRDLIGILTQLKAGDVLFVDEVHRIPAAVEEYLYTAMEDFSVDFTLDQGPNARILPLKLAPFTLVGATTREGLLSAPFRGRFGLLERLDPYPDEDLVTILARSARILDIELEAGAARAIAARARGTPRAANRFLRRVRDWAQVNDRRRADAALAEQALERLGVDALGLEELDRRILRQLAGQRGEPLGLKTVAAAVGESEDTIEEVYEPHLLRAGLIEKTPRGRSITAAGRRAIGLPPELAGGARPLFER